MEHATYIVRINIIFQDFFFMENMKTVCSIGGGDGVCVFVCTGDGGGVDAESYLTLLRLHGL